jgi:hypothetical protein
MINYNFWKKKKGFNQRCAGILAQGCGLLGLVTRGLVQA